MASTVTAPPCFSLGPALVLRHHRHHHRRRRHLCAASTPRTSLVTGKSLSTQVLGSPFLAIRPRRPDLFFTRHASASGGASAYENDDAACSESPARPPETDLPNARARLEDSYVGVFVRMLGLDNDPLDREQAVITLWSYSQGGKQCIDATMQFPGCVNLVTALLKSDSSSACEAAAGLLRNISSVSIYRESVAESGAIEEIAGLLCQPSSLTPEVIEQCLCTLWNLSIDEGFRVKIANSNLLPALINFLDDEEIKVKEAAGGVLANLALTHSNRGIMVEAGVIPKMAEVLKSDMEGLKVVRKEAKNALLELSKDEYYKILIIEEGLILVPMIGASAYKSFRPVSHSWPSLPDGIEIQRSSSPSRFGASELLLGLNIREKRELEEAKMKAVVGRSRQQFLARIGAIELEEGEKSQVVSSANEQQTLLSMVDGVARLVLILELEDISAISRAARAIGDALISEEMRISFKEAGAVTRLVQLLDHNDEAVREAATYALERLSISPEVCQMLEADNLFQPLFSFLKSTSTSESLKEKTVNILARICNPGKVMNAEFTDREINGSEKSSRATLSSQDADRVIKTSDSLSVRQVRGREMFFDSDVICCVVEIMKTSSPNLQRKVASILEYLASFDVHLTAITDAGIVSALLTVLQQRCMDAEEDDYEELYAIEAEETSLVISAASRLLTKLLDFEQFRSQIEPVPFVNLLRKILRSSAPLHGKDWIAACLVKFELMFGSGIDAEFPIDVEVTLFETIPRLVEQMKISSSLESREGAVLELNKIISKGMVECSRAIATAGGIFPLVELIDQVTGPALEAGLAVLYNLSMDSENHAAIIAAGAVPVLRRIVLSDGPQWTRALHLLRALPT